MLYVAFDIGYITRNIFDQINSIAFEMFRIIWWINHSPIIAFLVAHCSSLITHRSLLITHCFSL
jgi:hypothetical protein